jgi:ATP-binding cassette, subfamily B (MDR/TAP), member 1
MKAASRMYKIIDQEPTIDSKTSSSKGIKKDIIEGFIKFENVSFAYPKNKDITILNNLTLECFAGKDTAFVGDSGCGKSTIVQLVMRFYDPDQGRITLDGVDIKDYDLHWLREQIGYVGQEPSLFEGTVFENVRIGKSNAT